MMSRASLSRVSAAPGIRRRGVALVVVMWLVAALTVLVSALVANTRADLRGAANHRLFIEHAALGDGAIRLAALQLKHATEPLHGPFSTTVHFEGRDIVVTATPVAGLINLNAASQELLEALFIHGAGVSENDAAVLASRVIDWRDPDDAALPAGAENDSYEAAGSVFATRGGPFASVDDLVQVLGVSVDVHDKIRGLVTAYGGAAGVDPRFAPAGVLAVLARGRLDVVERIVATRAADEPLNDTTELEQQFITSTSDKLYRMEANQTMDGMRLSRVLWVDLGAQSSAGLPWREIAVESVRAIPQEFADGE